MPWEKVSAIILPYFCQKYQDHYKFKYAFKGVKDGNLIKGLLVRWETPENLILLIDTLFASTDDFYEKKGGRTIGVLSANENRLAQAAKAKHDGTDGMTELQRNNRKVCEDVLKEMG